VKETYVRIPRNAISAATVRISLSYFLLYMFSKGLKMTVNFRTNEVYPAALNAGSPDLYPVTLKGRQRNGEKMFLKALFTQ
jgi:hypothetical protein